MQQSMSFWLQEKRRHLWTQAYLIASQIRLHIHSEDWCLYVAAYLNCALLQFPFCYLGIPIGVNPKRKVVWEPIITKFEARLNKWNQRSISMAGRITLISVVLTALSLFYLSFFRAPTTVINRLSAIQRQFLWGGNREGKKIAWISWRQCCASR